MRGLTGGRPKELIDVAGEPLLVHVMRECVASGIEELLIVTAPGKEEIEETVAPLAGRPGMPARIAFVLQEEARGLADAIRFGRDFAGDAPLAVALPDNLFVEGRPALAQVIDTHLATRKSVVAIVEIGADEAVRRGATAIYQGTVNGDEFRITRIPDKGAHSGTFDTGGAASAYTGVGRYVFLPEAFAVIDDVEQSLPPGRELDDIPVMQRLVARGAMTGRIIRARFLDVGLPDGYREANEILARASRGSPA